MILAIIFLVLCLAFAGVSIYKTVSLVKTPMIEVDYKKVLSLTGAFVGASAICFLVASFGFYQWLNAKADALHTVQLCVGALLFIACLFASINAFIIHYYGRNLPEKLDKWLFRGQIMGFVLALIFLFVYTNGLAPYLSYPVANGISFKEGLVTPNSSSSPNIAFYAICILSGAILVYFVCDHYFYKEYGEHGLLETMFFISFPAGIIGARLWYVIGNWEVEFKGKEFWHVFAVWEGGLTILGGAIMGIVVGAIFYLILHKGKSLMLAVDIIVPTILIAQAVGRWGNFFNCEVHGLVTSIDNFKWLPEIIWRNGQYSSTNGYAGDGQMYVPLFFIEAFTNLLGYFVLAHVFGKALRKYTEIGDVGLGYIIWYGLTRVLMEPLRISDYQMGENGYWSWVWSMIFVFAGTLLIVGNHVIRFIIKKKKQTYVVKDNDKKVGLISIVIILIVSAALLAVGAYMMSNNTFVVKVTYNAFNIGLIILVLGASALLALGISLPILFEAMKKKQDALA